MISKKTQCITRLIEKELIDNLLEYMVDKKLIQNNLLQEHGRFPEKAADLIRQTLNQAEADDKLMLVSYEWKVLPVELINITIVDENGKQLFEWEVV